MRIIEHLENLLQHFVDQASVTDCDITLPDRRLISHGDPVVEGSGNCASLLAVYLESGDVFNGERNCSGVTYSVGVQVWVCDPALENQFDFVPAAETVTEGAMIAANLGVWVYEQGRNYFRDPEIGHLDSSSLNHVSATGGMMGYTALFNVII